MRKILIAALVLFGSASGAAAQNYGISGNDTGGIIPWSRPTEVAAHKMTDDFCGWYGKYARITGVNRHYGQYISFNCLWHPRVARYQLPEVRVAQRYCSRTWDWVDGRRVRVTVCE